MFSNRYMLLDMYHTNGHIQFCKAFNMALDFHRV